MNGSRHVYILDGWIRRYSRSGLSAAPASSSRWAKSRVYSAGAPNSCTSRATSTAARQRRGEPAAPIGRSRSAGQPVGQADNLAARQPAGRPDDQAARQAARLLAARPHSSAGRRSLNAAVLLPMNMHSLANDNKNKYYGTPVLFINHVQQNIPSIKWMW